MPFEARFREEGGRNRMTIKINIYSSEINKQNTAHGTAGYPNKT